VLALSIVFMQRLSNVSVATNNFGIQGARAWQAAQAGAEWGVFQVLASGCPAASTTFNLTEEALSGFTVTVNCQADTYTEEGTTVTLYRLDILSTFGTVGVTPDFASRRLALTVEN
ncbi:MAG: pilus assembly protein MshP, partial [Enterobacterales bacterium]|nr:pilus assembly protein MshP [Enterobacterales bacterium]